MKRKLYRNSSRKTQIIIQKILNYKNVIKILYLTKHRKSQ